MSTPTHYVFHSVWSIDAAVEDVSSVLADVVGYPSWWPEVRSVEDLGNGRFAMVARSLLPYELRTVSEPGAGNGEPGVISARLSGDLVGTARWSMERLGDSCRLVYDQEVETHATLLNVFAPIGRPAFRLNHRLMMRHGQAGLRTYMAGYRRGIGETRRSQSGMNRAELSAPVPPSE